MRLSLRAVDALRALTELAAAREETFVPAAQLAGNQEIPGRRLAVVMTELRRAGLVKNQRGPRGGFCLARPASQTSLAEIRIALAIFDDRRDDNRSD